jgi:hypothetical protein
MPQLSFVIDYLFCGCNTISTAEDQIFNIHDVDTIHRHHYVE